MARVTRRGSVSGVGPSKPWPVKQRETGKGGVMAGVIEWLQLNGYTPERLQSGTMRGVSAGWISQGRKGRPDLLALRQAAARADWPTCFYVEVKKPGGTVSKDQMAEHARLRELGHPVVVAWTAHPSGWDWTGESVLANGKRDPAWIGGC